MEYWTLSTLCKEETTSALSIRYCLWRKWINIFRSYVPVLSSGNPLAHWDLQRDMIPLASRIRLLHKTKHLQSDIKCKITKWPSKYPLDYMKTDWLSKYHGFSLLLLLY
jgi:hypothetical protein